MTDVEVTAKKRKRNEVPQRSTPFQTKHALQFGLNATQHDKGVVTSVECLFCKRVGRSGADDDKRKRARTISVKIFGPPFRKENFHTHVTRQHKEEFAEYTELSNDDKRKFFAAKKHVQDSILRYMNPSQTALAIPVSKEIVEVIIGEMFFNPELDEDDEQSEPISKANALKLFVAQPDGSYVAKIANPTVYDLVLKHTSCGLSFRQTAAVIGHHKLAFGNARLAGVSDHDVGKMVRVNVGANLQVLSDVLNDEEVWAFSLAGDGTTHQVGWVASFFNMVHLFN